MTPLTLLPRFRKLDRALSTLADAEAWPRERIEAHQLERIHALWTHAVRCVPYYRALHETRPFPEAFESLDHFCSAVPLLPKDVVRAEPARLLAEGYEAGRWHRTGGSTGVPMRVFWSRDAHQTGLRIKYRAEAARGLGVFDRKAFLWGHGASMAGGWRGAVARLRQPVEDRLRRRMRLSAYRLGQADLDGYLDAIARFAPLGLYGYSSAVSLLAQAARRRAWECPSLRLVTLSAEPAYDWIVREAAEGLGAEVLVEYGSVECGVMATQDARGDLRIREDHVLLETLPADEEGRYPLVVTVLYNPAFPLIRYPIGDLTSAPIDKPAVGFTRLADVLGRDNDLLWSKQGRAVHPLAVKHVVEHVGEVRRFSAHQKADGSLEVLLETNAVVPVDPIADRLSQLLSGFVVRVRCVDALEGNAAGKHRWVLSDYEPRQAARWDAEEARGV
ncbi:MAG: hypothetical protein AAGF84_01750 [Planctomycetota bacterium]